MSKDELDRRIRELEASVPLWKRIFVPEDAQRTVVERLMIKLWAMGLPQALIGAAITLAGIAALPSTGVTLVSSVDARLAAVVRAHLPDADRLAPNDLMARISVGDRAVKFVRDVVGEPLPPDTLSWIGRLSFKTPPLVRGDRAEALADIVRLLGDLPTAERLTRLDWLVTFAAETSNPHSGLAHALQALSSLPVALRQQLLFGDAAELKGIIRLKQERDANRASLGSVEQDLSAETIRLAQETARRRNTLDLVKQRYASVSAIGATCAAQWQRFDACTTGVLSSEVPALSSPRPTTTPRR
ncbi:hypothetical protein [Bosea sp. PAMC 26642]|uniref:hypothetical protein n=1 Tax=Bosea sp. (strain PAMC 26642) TaxID=1792307 RepID=UPI0007705551|nr:hypothetical protein [Bosea sp. PAMC 26642]AMJ61594.1 hypothetical protein AXW83_15920 [Bosea sp. PAMC 26642]